MFRKDASQEEKNKYYQDFLRKYIDSFNNKDVDAICKCYAQDAVFEDPVGNPEKYCEGIVAIRKFYEASVQRAKLEITGPIRGSYGAHAAMPIRGYLKGLEIDVISVADFNDDGKLQRYHTYYGPDNIRKVP